MLKQGYIDQAAYDEAMADDVYARIQSVNEIQTDSSNAYSYFVDALADQVMNDLQDQCGFSETQAYNAVYSGGLSIYSTQNQSLQQICDEEANDDSNYPSNIEYGLDYALTVTRADGSTENYSSGHIKKYVKETYNKDQGLLYKSEDAARAMVEEWKSTIAQEGDTYNEVINISPQPQASITLMDQYTGQIKAMVGGRGAKSTSLGLNRAYKGSKRQPGSTFKILAAYAPALDLDEMTLASVIDDKNYDVGGGKTIKGSKGDVSMRTAIALSLNSCAVQTSDLVTQDVGMEYCEKLGISTLVTNKVVNGKTYSDNTKTLALGGLTDGVYNYELCSAYAAIANNGVYNKPTLYTKVLDHDGNVLLDGTGESHQAIKDSTAGLLTSALQTVVEEGTGKACQLDNMPVAGKTGTTNSSKDVWFCGYTKYYTTVVWAGYDTPRAMPGASGASIPGVIWKDYMDKIHEKLKPQDFTMPSTISLAKYDSAGNIIEGTAVAGSKTRPAGMDYFSKSILSEKAEEVQVLKDKQYQKEVLAALKKFEKMYIKNIADYYDLENDYKKLTDMISSIVDDDVRTDYAIRARNKYDSLKDETVDWKKVVKAYEKQQKEENERLAEKKKNDSQRALNNQIYKNRINLARTRIKRMHGYVYQPSNMQLLIDSAKQALDACKGYAEYTSLKAMYDEYKAELENLPTKAEYDKKKNTTTPTEAPVETAEPVQDGEE